MKTQVRLALFAAVFALVSAPAQIAKPTADESALAGDWRGDSICVVRPSACHDEKTLYHVKKLGDKPNHYSMQLDKIVEGKAEEMGTVECNYAPEQHALTCSTPRIVLRLTLDRKSLEGTMNLP